ncbi:MAG: c-type cytochrome domain-containing protein, partial [Planctomycetota bacterium]|nr:c-type cytochrome domain-containing protein [Planctomycetota bacterium]
MSRLSILFGVAFFLPFASVLHAQEKLDPEHEKFFESNIRPVLVKNCYGCHSQKTGKARGGLMLDTKDGLLGVGDSGEGVVP